MSAKALKAVSALDAQTVAPRVDRLRAPIAKNRRYRPGETSSQG
jgi:hypothetical protein